MRLVVDTLSAARLFGNSVDTADLWQACWAILQDQVAQGIRIGDAREWHRQLAERMLPQINRRTFIVPFVGVDFRDIDALPLGSSMLLRPSVKVLDGTGVDHGFADISSCIAVYRHNELWLMGIAHGTQAVAERRFRALADLLAGYLAVAAAVIYEAGATQVFISSNMAVHDTHGRATWFSWEEEGANFAFHGTQFLGVPFVIDANLRQQLTEVSVMRTALRIFESDARTELEEAIARGFHWFADAHRDATRVMQFVKYWSCIETFFSKGAEEITQSLARGVAAVLVFGGYAFAPIESYLHLKKRIADLYDARSKAVHRALRDHVDDTEIAELSHYTAQLLVNTLSFVERGYKTLAQVKEQCERLDRTVRQK